MATNYSNTFSDSAALAAAADRLLEEVQRQRAANTASTANDVRNILGGGSASGGSSAPTADEIRKILGVTGTATSSGAGQTAGNQSAGPVYDYPSYEDYYQSAGYQAAQEEQRKALESYVDQILNDINAQKQSVERDAVEMARQAYVSYMQAKNTLPQSLAAKGYTGGMADSQMINLETNLQNNQQQIAKNKSNTLTQLELAAANARSQASQEAAKNQADIALAASNAWNSYISQINNMANSNYWKQAAQEEPAAQTKPKNSKPFQWLYDMINGGIYPDQAIINLPQLTPGERKELEMLVSAEEWMK